MHTLGQRNIAHMDRIPDVQRRHIHLDVLRQILWQTLHIQRADDLLQQPAARLHARRLAAPDDRHRRVHHLVLFQRMEIHM